ncbi:MAG: acyl carrier protein [Clostridiales bacterium]|nr:acyl carrier protein [Clostridiales bacterium]
MNSRDDIKKKVREIVAHCLDNNIDPDDLKEDTQLGENLHFDSIVYISLIVMLEDQFNVIIPDDSLSLVQYTTYGDIENMILRVIEDVN